MRKITKKHTSKHHTQQYTQTQQIQTQIKNKQIKTKQTNCETHTYYNEITPKQNITQQHTDRTNKTQKNTSQSPPE